MSDSAKITEAYVVRKVHDEVHGQVETIGIDDLPPGDVTIEVDWSSANYKDALAASGHPGVARRLPHVPGIDVVGRVMTSQDDRLSPGTPVIVTGNELGAGVWGGWSGIVRVPADWVVTLPTGLSPREAMILGTAGFTAAQCVMRLQGSGVTPDRGPIVVTGATGGVGCLAIQILDRAGYDVVASTGKTDAVSWLHELGADEVISREALTENEDPNRPLGSSRWAGAIDTVGGPILATLVRTTKLHGCVSCCGMVAGNDLPLNVYPFILRGVTLAGITSQNCPLAERQQIWQRLATDWRVNLVQVLTNEVGLADVGWVVSQLLAGQARGRTIVKLAGA